MSDPTQPHHAPSGPPFGTPAGLARAHRWLTRLLPVGVAVVIVVSVVAIPADARARTAGAALVLGPLVGLVVVAAFAAVAFARSGELVEGLQNGARPAALTAVGAVCLGLAVYSAPGISAVATLVVVALATAGVKTALRRARRSGHQLCSQCGQGRIEQYRVKGTGEVVQVCFTCETTWSPDPEMTAAAPNGMPLRLYMAGRGFEPYWEGLEELRERT
jgi:hypothetical protein